MNAEDAKSIEEEMVGSQSLRYKPAKDAGSPIKLSEMEAGGVAWQARTTEAGQGGRGDDRTRVK